MDVAYIDKCKDLFEMKLFHSGSSGVLEPQQRCSVLCTFMQFFCAWIMLSKRSVCTFPYKVEFSFKVEENMSRQLAPGQYWRSYVITEQCHRKKTTIFVLLQRWKDIFWIIVISKRWQWTLPPFYCCTEKRWPRGVYCVLHRKCCLKPKTEELSI